MAKAARIVEPSTRADEPAAEWVAIDDLKPWARNPRKNDAAVKKVAAAIRRFGFGAPVVARKANSEIIAGHTRVKAAKSIGLTHVPVRFLDLSESEAHKLAVADNRTAEEASWSTGDLADLVSEWSDAGDDLKELGFDENELEKLLGENYESEVQQVDVSTARAEFFLSVHGPLPKQADALDALKRSLQELGLTVSLTTSEL